MKNRRSFSRSAITLATAYAKQDKTNKDEKASDESDELVIPEDLTELSNEELDALSEKALEVFNAVYGDGSGLNDEDLETIEGMTEGIEALQVEQAARAEADSERSAKAAELAARVRPNEETAEETDEDSEEDSEDEDKDEDKDEAEEVESSEESEENELEAVAASSTPRREMRVNLAGLHSQSAQSAKRNSGTPKTMKDIVMAAPDVPGFTNGQGMDFNDLGKAVDRRLQTFNKATYESAAKNGRHMRQQFGVAVINKTFEDGLTINSDDPNHIEEVFSRAVDEKRLPGKSLTASGGWCAPSETRYDLFEMESRDGLFSVPEVNVARGGIRFTPGPDFSTIYSSFEGFSYTEQEDIDADYDGNGAGTKPCVKVDCPNFTEVRLGLEGLCITAGLLQSRGFPEVIARTIRGALVAHDHRLAGKVVADIVAGSDAVTMTADQVGTAAPVLASIGLQVEHYRAIHRLSRSTTLEATFPFWIREAIRGDLSRRAGVDMISVPDSRINAWFSERGINPQFIYNWQDPTGTAANWTGWPSTVKFLLYAAGTWVKGGSDVITLDTIYDSVNLGTNDYTALFTEEGYLVAKRGHDSRVITVPVCPDGGTGAGVPLDCDGVAIPEPEAI